MITGVFRKVELFIISLWLLFLLIAIKGFVVVSDQFLISWQGISNLVKPNILPLISILFVLIGFGFYVRFTYLLRGAKNLPKKIKKIEDQNYETLTFLTTYIIPFLRINLVGRDLLVTVILLFVIGAIFVKTNLFYKNPTLALLGYRLYKVDTETLAGAIFISRGPLKIGDSVRDLHLADNIYFVRQ